MFRLGLPVTLLVLLLGVSLQAGEPAAFPLKDGDVWVMAGDSITAQHLHSNYFEAFCYARYPKLKFAFRNSGVGGHTIPSTLARFDYDVAGWKPTVVSVASMRPDAGSEWRINFSRVEWQVQTVDGKYQKLPGTKEDNWVWSPQGVVNMHVPEHWGRVKFLAN